MDWTVLTFDEHEGKTLPYVIFTDPGWFFWNIEKRTFKGRGGLETQAKELNYKVRHIRIPKRDRKTDHCFHHFGRTRVCISLVPKDYGFYKGLSQDKEQEIFNLSCLEESYHYSKFQYNILVFSAKMIMFGKMHMHMSEQYYEKFFENDNNFEIDTITRQWLDKMWR